MKGKLPAMECLEAVVDANILPWQINVKWSENAPTLLGDVPDRPPRKMTMTAIHNSFRILRITNQGVKDLDKTVKHFKQLEKLILTANNIQKVDSRHLPPNLEFLELCANAITSLSPICLRPPPLTHLGVGYNRVRSLDGCVSASLWPRLLSLDLSFNDLDDLHDVVAKMALLPSLRSLLLLGNPLSLAPGYRGFIVDYLKDLLIFDDVFISADERHDFDGLGAKKAKVKNAARVTLEALTVRGISAPTDEKPSDDNQEFPIVSRKFALYFLLPLDPAQVKQARARVRAAEAAAEAEAAAAAAAAAATAAEKDDEMQQRSRQQQRPVVPVILEGRGSLTGSVRYPGEDAAAAAAEDEEEGEEAAKPKKKIPLPKVEEELIIVPEGDDGEYAVKATKTNPVAWAEEIELNWKKEIERSDVLVTRNFFKNGMDVHIVEEKVLAYPSDQIEGLESRLSSPGDGARSAASKAGAGAKSRAEVGKGGKDAKGGGGGTAGGSGGDRKKKKEPVTSSKRGGGKKKTRDTEVDLFYMPPEVTVLAKCRVQMAEFLDGETELDFVFYKEGDKETVVKTAKRDRDAEKEEKDKDKGKSKGGLGGAAPPGGGGKKEEDAGKKGAGGAPKVEEKPPASKQASERGGGKSSATAKSTKGGEKGAAAPPGGGVGAKGERVGTAENIAEEVALPPPIECHFRVYLAKWKKTADATPAAVEKKKSTTSKAGRTSGRKSAKAEN